MALPFTFATEGGNQASSQLDANFNAVGAMGCIACVATGTNSILLAPSANQPTVSAYSGFQQFAFNASAGSTGPVTVNVNSVGALNLYLPGGTVRADNGNITNGAFYIIAYDATLNGSLGGFVIVSSIVTTTPQFFTNSLVADVALNNIANYFDGPVILQGQSGTWWVSGSVTVTDTAGNAAMSAKLWDGTTVMDSTSISTAGANNTICISLSGFIANPVSNIRISVKDGTSTSGKILFNQSGNSKDSTVSAFRINGT